MGPPLAILWFGDTGAPKLADESIVAMPASYDPEMNCIPRAQAWMAEKKEITVPDWIRRFPDPAS